MRFFKSIIYLLNWDTCAKRITFIFLVLKLSIANIVFLLSGGESLKDLMLSSYLKEKESARQPQGWFSISPGKSPNNHLSQNDSFKSLLSNNQFQEIILEKTSHENLQ